MKKISLPLVHFLNEKRQGTLLDNPDKLETPESITANLHHRLRPYQKAAIFNFQWLQQNSDVDWINTQYKQLLFNMATGSGKTDLMAAIILYMYDKFNYQNFLFVANSNAVVNKTKDNFLHADSNKYLFNDPITINGQHITIIACEQYPTNPSPGTIYIKLTTIQSLDSEWNYPKENGLTRDQLENKKIVILADEAHHYSATTKDKEISKTSWESVLNDIRGLNPLNRQLEFTATLNFDNDAVEEKYKDKVIYQYNLSHFQYDGYSKNIYRLQANNDDEDKMLNAILLSQFRKDIAYQNNIPDFKPVVLFKSNSIPDSNKYEEQFHQMLDNMTATSLDKYINEERKVSHSYALNKAMDHFKLQNIEALVNSLKDDFQPMNTINVNVSSNKNILSDYKNSYQLNTLENKENPVRGIFAVAKLNEGWDVLNLFDIVRLGEKQTGIKQTDSEAQLIGRGARYYPFVYKNKSSYTRRFDTGETRGNDLQLLESLYYHTINQSKYLDNLKASFDKIDLRVKDDNELNNVTYFAHVKKQFKHSNTYRNGKVYYNSVETKPDDYFDGINKYNVDTNETYIVDLTTSVYEANYNDLADENQSGGTNIRAVTFDDPSDSFIIKEALARNSFYRFDKLKSYLPTLHSIREFIVSNNWLGKAKVDAKVDNNSNGLTIDQKLEATIQYLSTIQRKITNNFNKKRGTNRFYPMPIKDLIHDYSKNVSDKISNQHSTTELIRPHSMKNREWFVYDNAIVDSLEKECIDVIGGVIERNNLLTKYKNVYLFRNEETSQYGIKLHQFNSGVNDYRGYMPDFILYLNGYDNCSYQIYVEPKGEYLLTRDAWKEQLLKSIRPDKIQVIGENDDVKLYGLKFYRKGDLNHLEEGLDDDDLL